MVYKISVNVLVFRLDFFFKVVILHELNLEIKVKAKLTKNIHLVESVKFSCSPHGQRLS